MSVDLENTFERLIERGVYQYRVSARYDDGSDHFIGYYREAAARKLASRREVWGRYAVEPLGDNPAIDAEAV